MLRKSLAYCFLAAVLVSSVSTALAASGTYESTYSLTGGLNSRTFDASATPKFVVTTSPTKGLERSTMTLYLRKQGVFGDTDIDSGTVSSTKVDSETLYKSGSGSGQYYIRFRNLTGVLFEGKVKIDYSW
ncbi:hypothetical protein [Geobacillus stearothermophilus]|uniref:hypothetical protein n=1 Tax=Geobacillus stearothermophilus TaxID=1422 RepID=UPI003D205945